MARKEFNSEEELIESLLSFATSYRNRLIPTTVLLRDEGYTYANLYSALLRIEKEGLVEFTSHNKDCVSLTQKGKEIAGIGYIKYHEEKAESENSINSKSQLSEKIQFEKLLLDKRNAKYLPYWNLINTIIALASLALSIYNFYLIHWFFKK